MRTCSSISKLPAGHVAIVERPQAVTYRAPGLIETDLKTTFKVISTIHQSNGSIFTENWRGGEGRGGVGRGGEGRGGEGREGGRRGGEVRGGEGRGGEGRGEEGKCV